MTCPSGYTYYNTITVQATQVGTQTATQSNFPMLFSTTTITLSTITASGGHVINANGYDIVFSTTTDGTFQLSYDTETYNATTGKLEYWVKIPSISSTTNTAVYIFYGNSGISTYQSFSTATWDSNYLGVWHLKNGTTLNAMNSVTVASGTVSGAVAIAGQIDGGASYANATDIITSDLSIPLPSSTTWEAWAYRTGSNTAPRIFSMSNFFALRDWTATDISWIANFDGGQAIWSVAPPASDSWHHIAVTYDATNASNDPLIYVNGSTQTLTTDTNTTGTVIGQTLPVKFGNRDDLGRPWLGSLDELRLSNNLRSRDWIKTEYNNQSSPSTFFSYGTETTCAAAVVAPPANIRGLSIKGGKMTINGGKVTIL